MAIASNQTQRLNRSFAQPRPIIVAAMATSSA